MIDQNFWKGKRVFLTGHTGFKGSWTALWLHSLGAIVKGYALSPPTGPSLFNEAKIDSIIDSKIGDIRNQDVLYESMTTFNPDILIHMAAQPLVRYSYDAPIETYEVNVIGTAKVLEVARSCANLKAIVNITTDKCYENDERSEGYKESDPMGGYDPYSSSKGCAELVTSSYRRSFLRDQGVGLASVRAGNVIGGGDWANDRLIPDILRFFEKGRPVIIRNPKATRPWQHVLEPLSGYLILAQRLYENQNKYAEGWNFGPNEQDVKPVDWILDKMISKWPNSSWELDSNSSSHEAKFLKLDISKAKTKLGWKPVWELSYTLEKIIAWHGAWLDRADMQTVCLIEIEEYMNDMSTHYMMSKKMKCRHCKVELKLPLIDLGSAPPSNAYLTKEALNTPEKWFPLRVLVCENCWLVQTEDFAQADELFDEEYAYFSSFSTSWLQHAEQYVKDMIKRFSLDENSHVIEVAANDGYLLQYVKGYNIPCTGIEPTTSTANAAREKGIDILEEFFGVKLAQQLVKQGKQSDLTISNNVLAHVPDINDFVAGFSILLKPNGVATFEFPHLLKLINENQFDTIYHEHFSYLSLTALEDIFKENGLQIFDVEEYATHGGSLRIFAQRSDTGVQIVSKQVIKLHKSEIEAGVNCVDLYKDFQEKANIVKDNLLNFLIKAKQDNKKVVAYGAAAKGNTLLNYAGVRPDLITYVVDKNPNKQNKCMPGSRIPIRSEEYLKSDKPDYVLILPWNLKKEIMAQLDYIKDSGGRFVIAIPELEIIK